MMNNISSCFLGHKSRCFDVKTRQNNHGDHYLLTSSEDGSAILWFHSHNVNLKSKKPLYTFKHSNDSEVLRSLFLNEYDSNGNIYNSLIYVCTCGADGVSIIWREHISDSSNSTIINSSSPSIPCNINFTKVKEFKHCNGDQIYACENIFLHKMNLLITAAGNLLYVWNLNLNLNHESNSNSQANDLVYVETPLITFIFHDSTYSLYSMNDNTNIQATAGLSVSTSDGTDTDADTAADYDTNSMSQHCADHQISSLPSSDPLLKEMISNTHTNNNDPSSSHFGGVRNEEQMVFLFDIKCHPIHKHILAVATSECDIHFMNLHELLCYYLEEEEEEEETSAAVATTNHHHSEIIRQAGSICVKNKHVNFLTSISWHPTQSYLLACAGSGTVVLIDTREMNILAYISAAHDHVMFGSQFLSSSSQLLTPTSSSTTTTTTSTTTINHHTTTSAAATETINYENQANIHNQSYTSSSSHLPLRLNSVTATVNSNTTDLPVIIADNSIKFITWSSDTYIKLWRVQMNPKESNIKSPPPLQQSHTTTRDSDNNSYNENIKIECLSSKMISNYPIMSCEIISQHTVTVALINTNNDTNNSSINNSNINNINDTNIHSTYIENNPSYKNHSADYNRSDNSNCNSNSHPYHIKEIIECVCAGGDNRSVSFLGTPIHIIQLEY